MAMQYMKSIRRKPVAKTESTSTPAAETHGPVLTDEDEAFLHHVATSSSISGSDSGDKQPGGSKDEQGRELVDEPLDDDLRRLAEDRGSQEKLDTPDTEPTAATASSASTDQKKMEKGHKSRKSLWGMLKDRKWMGETEKVDKGKGKVADDTQSSSEAAGKGKNEEEKKEDQDLSKVLEQLNLAAVNNRVFSISSDTQALLEQFKQVFKDLVNGVPTAYRDLESLLTNGDQELQKSYTKLPSFLQKLVEKLPNKMTEKFAPEILAAASARASKSGINMQHVDKATSTAKKIGIEVPNLKELAGKPAALAGLLRSIIAFLRARFPALIGMNVLWSLGLFILLMVLWYCHKRGREERLAREASMAGEGEKAEGEEARVIDVTDEASPSTTPAAVGAPAAATGTVANTESDAQLTRQVEGQVQAATTQIEAPTTATSEVAAKDKEPRQTMEEDNVKV
ncbi:hypothetical protein H112_05359 [Trichophyton rubrum D6]|uniref:Ring-like domain-containing protein n=4 Tax=Trichophyton TaxID=5550 RepID=A0A178ERL2_TRIRU|nr:uncharacterized protein TERG_03099 [Trichophyton rubrum CBS 118892]EZF19050.1 hypothetical protein H100_05377 [Trichophyton rubrum MR850]EZF40714.1 hypothetical protein H102_05342 [Trichophyton rubrum CBS 100081]EZF51345.1 hypothetical protein H103_05368 [Trichophyton rubrum CBS 288.86]EZF61931.1 hypothetical protein H104_05358 [Trichophyton rubrum CBS 289.86]EZF72566.1 hypothetical protein H105_05386 [Trichophyton soudanense CBS 452.61]EZF83250.1 hypothetical protein H110_05364 [Trichophy